MTHHLYDPYMRVRGTNHKMRHLRHWPKASITTPRLVARTRKTKENEKLRIHTGIGSPIWLSEREGGGLIVVAGHSRLLLSREELPQFVDAIYIMTGVRADPITVARTPKATIQRFPVGT